MTIVFDTVDAPTKVAEKDITKNPYWPVIDAIKDADGKAAKFAIPTETGDDFKKATGRVRSKLNEISNHLDRTIRASFEEKDAKTYATVWVMDKKIKRAKKEETPTPATVETSAETETETAPAETETAPAETETAPAETETAPAETAPVERKNKRGNRAA